MWASHLPLAVRWNFARHWRCLKGRRAASSVGVGAGGPAQPETGIAGGCGTARHCAPRVSPHIQNMNEGPAAAGLTSGSPRSSERVPKIKCPAKPTPHARRLHDGSSPALGCY